MRRLVSRRPEDRGAAAVEFALVAPVLLLILFGIISYGFMLAFRQSMSQAAAEGSRAVAVLPVSSTVTAAQQADAARAGVNNSLSSFGVTCVGSDLKRGSTVAGTCIITVAPCVGQTTVNCATVSLDYSYRDHPLVPTLFGFTLPSSLSYAASTQVN
ncbi:TadE/TadG family type IV pilus assembly protein [Nocardioides rubriscoriae]|uniref:TadE/TadG family type IV pilus assembly protein n=1 Tax=Nocardioides rubriscoriae TaxID=642762 RepID=UPI00147839BC|nr:TadE family protein [Nocardioides rubriscoriae]